MTAFKLPLPPSANELVRPTTMGDLACVYCHNRPPKRPLVRLVATAEAKDFRRTAHRHLPVKPVGGPVELYVTVYVCRLSSDGLNRIKALEDAINERLWFDDKQIGEWHIKKILVDDESQEGVVFHVQPVDPTDADHHELARRLARSTIGEKTAAAKQPQLFSPPRPVVPGEPTQQRLARLATAATYRNDKESA